MALNFAATLSPSKSSFHGGSLLQSPPNLLTFHDPLISFPFSQSQSTSHSLHGSFRSRRRAPASECDEGKDEASFEARQGLAPPPHPYHIPQPPYVATWNLPEIASEYRVHDPEGIEKMRAACELAARVLNYAGTLVRPSVTMEEIDKAVHQMIVDTGAYPSPLGGFPKSVCTSVNECMCHGIPDSRQLQGYHGDTSKTFICGNVTNEVERLVKVTKEYMERGIAVCKDGVSFKMIGKRISEHAERYGFRVVERFVGHGVGTIFHSQPIINHHRNEEPGVMVDLARQLDNPFGTWRPCYTVRAYHFDHEERR